MNVLSRTLALGLLCGAGLPAAAAETSPYFGLSGSYLAPDSARALDDGYGGTVLMGFPANRWFATELNLFGQRADREAGTGRDSLLGGGLDFRVLLAPAGSRLQPFALVGGGAEQDRFAGDRQTAGYANAGGGLLWNFQDLRHTALRLDARRYGVFSDEIVPGRDRLYDTRVNLGVQFNLVADEPAPVAAPAPTEPPQPVDGDGDGVADMSDACPGTPRGTTVDARGCPVAPPKAEPLPAPAPVDSDRDGVLDLSDTCPDTVPGLRVDASGCAVKAQVVVLRDVNFEYNAATLTADARAILDGIAAGLRGQPSMEVRIEGHTDARGKEAYNLKLSKARAQSVREYLIQRGVEGARLGADGYGERKPVASNDTESGRAQNRRVEFKVIKQ